MSVSGRDRIALASVLLASFAVGELAIFRRPDLTRNWAFLFGEPGVGLFVTDNLLHGARLYRDVSYPYGWLPAALFVAVAGVFGNTPLVYVHFFLAVSLAGLACAYAALRRSLTPALAAVVCVVGLMPVFVMPGALLGNYMAAFYHPVERLLLVTVVLIWRPPHARSDARAAALGALIAALQITKFGPGIVLLGVLLALDALFVAARVRENGPRALRAVAATAATAAAGELLIVAMAFALLPGQVASDVVWPAYLIRAYPPASQRWPALSDPALLAGQYANPLIGIVLTLAAAWLLLSRRRGADRPEWALLVLPALYVAGAFTYFRTDHHFRQLAWVWVFGAAAAIAQSPRLLAVALAGWLPVAAVVARSVVRQPSPAYGTLTTPSGWRLAVRDTDRARLDGIVTAIHDITGGGGGAVLIDPSGAGLLVAYGFPHVSRQNWFYPLAVRPYEVETLNRQYGAVTALVRCGPIRNLPPEIDAVFQARIVNRAWSDGECDVYRLRAAASGASPQ